MWLSTMKTTDIGPGSLKGFVARLDAVSRSRGGPASLVPAAVWLVAAAAIAVLPFFLYGAFTANIERLDGRIVETATDRLAPLVRRDGIPRGLATEVAALLEREDLALTYLTVRNPEGEVLISEGRFETLGEFLSPGLARRFRSWLYRADSADRSLSWRRDGRLVGYMTYGVDLRHAVIGPLPWFWSGLLLWFLALLLLVVFFTPAHGTLARFRKPSPARPSPETGSPTAASGWASGDEEAEWRRLVDTLRVGFVVVDGLQRVQAANALVGEMLGKSAGPLRGTSADELAVFTDDHGKERLSPLQRCLAGEAGPLRDTLNVAGKQVVMVAGRADKDRAYALLWRVDEGDRERKRRAAAASDFAGTALWEHAEEAVALVDVEGIVRSVNPAMCRLLRKEDVSLVGAPLVRLLPEVGGALVSTDDVTRGETILGTEPDNGVRIAYRLAMIDADGVPIYLMTLRTLPEPEEVPSGDNDALTGLPLRGMLMAHLRSVWSKDDFAAARALLVMDIVDFGRRNRSLGRDAGDTLLAAFARRLEATVPGAEKIVRLGGDEFAVLLRLSADTEDPETTARRICEAFAEPVRGGGLELIMAVNVGLAVAPDDADSPEELRQRAETALAVVQQAGDHVPRRYVPDMAETAADSGAAVRALRRALARRDLTLRLRPVWRKGADAAIAGAHVEIAWDLPEGGRRAGEDLFAYAEDLGLADELAAWCLRVVVETHADWRNIGLTPVPLLLPLPARLVQRPMLARAWQAAESRWRIPPPAIILLPQGDAERIVAVGPRLAGENDTEGVDVLCMDGGTLKFDTTHAEALVSAARKRGIPVIAGPLKGKGWPEFLDDFGIEYWYTTDDAVVTARAFGRLIARHGAEPL